MDKCPVCESTNVKPLGEVLTPDLMMGEGFPQNMMACLDCRSRFPVDKVKKDRTITVILPQTLSEIMGKKEEEMGQSPLYN